MSSKSIAALLVVATLATACTTQHYVIGGVIVGGTSGGMIGNQVSDQPPGAILGALTGILIGGFLGLCIGFAKEEELSSDDDD